MTANQVAYWQLQESNRHNLQDESVKRKDVSTKAERAKVQNETDVRNATTREREASVKERSQALAEEMAPYEKANKVLGGVGQAAKGGASVAKLFM